MFNERVIIESERMYWNIEYSLRAALQMDYAEYWKEFYYGYMKLKQEPNILDKAKIVEYENLLKLKPTRVFKDINKLPFVRYKCLDIMFCIQSHYLRIGEEPVRIDKKAYKYLKGGASWENYKSCVARHAEVDNYKNT